MRAFFRVCLFICMLLGSVATASAVAAQDGCDLTGTSGPDSLEGGSGSQVICGLGGADWLEGDSGNDTISGNGGADTIHGGSGKDDLYGNAGRDELYGDSGSDTLTGGNGADFFSGGPGYDVATDFECGVDEHDGTVEEGIDCAGGGSGLDLPGECSETANGFNCDFTEISGPNFYSANCDDESSSGDDIEFDTTCTVDNVAFSCHVYIPDDFFTCTLLPE